MPRKARALPGPAKVEGFVEVAEGVHAFIGGGGATNFGLVLTKEKPVVIDNDIRARKAFVAGMRKITRKSPGLTLNTHHIFPGRSFGRILGFGQMGGGLASAAGPWLAGYFFDVWRSYYWAFILVLAVQALSMAAVAAASSGAGRRAPPDARL